MEVAAAVPGSIQASGRRIPSADSSICWWEAIVPVLVDAVLVLGDPLLLVIPYYRDPLL